MVVLKIGGIYLLVVVMLVNTFPSFAFRGAVARWPL